MIIKASRLSLRIGCQSHPFNNSFSMIFIQIFTLLWIGKTAGSDNITQSEWHKAWPVCGTGKIQSPIDIKKAGAKDSINAVLGFENIERMYRVDLKNSARIEYPFSILRLAMPGQEESIYQSTAINIKAPG